MGAGARAPTRRCLRDSVIPATAKINPAKSPERAHGNSGGDALLFMEGYDIIPSIPADDTRPVTSFKERKDT